MATYILHILIMGKVEIDFFFVSMVIFGKFFTEIFIENFSRFHKTLVQIPIFDWLPERQKV